MSLKKFNEFEYIKENIFDEEEIENTDNDDIENKWEIRVNNETESYWEYKHDAIDQVLEILDNQGANSLEGYKDEDDYEPSKNELADLLDSLDESDFYDMIEELKSFVDYHADIKLINIDDEDEIEFLDDIENLDEE